MKKIIISSAVIMGISGISAEIILLRELLIVFSGNELIIGIIFANWLFLEALGSLFFAKLLLKIRNRAFSFAIAAFIFSFSLFASLFAIRYLRVFLDISPAQPLGFLTVFYTSFIILLPVSLSHGALYTLTAGILSDNNGRGNNSGGFIYAFETVGSVIGGIVFTFLLITVFDSLTIFALVAFLNFTVCSGIFFFSAKGFSHKFFSFLHLTAAIFFIALIFSGKTLNLHNLSVNHQWRNMDVRHYENSHFGNITVTYNMGQYTFFYDGDPVLMTPVPDLPFVEEFIHFPLLAQEAPSSLLFIGGGAGGMIYEALKHKSVEKIVYCELDPLMIKTIRRFSTELTDTELDSSRVDIKLIDGRLKLNTSEQSYDVIFAAINEPSSLQTNRFFTGEFYLTAKKRLNPRGIFVCTAPGSFMLMNNELASLNSTVYHTLKSAFKYVKVIPGEGRNIFLSSDSDTVTLLNTDLAVQRSRERFLDADAVMPWYIEQKLNENWQNWFYNFIEAGENKINSDFKPEAVFLCTAYRSSQFSQRGEDFFNALIRYKYALIFIPLLLLFAFRLYQRGKPAWENHTAAYTSIVTTGFAGMMFNLCIIFAFQIVYGYVFAWIGIITAFYMTGSGAGAFISALKIKSAAKALSVLKKVDLLIMILSLAFPLFFILLKQLSSYGIPQLAVQSGFIAAALTAGLAGGLQFPAAEKIIITGSESDNEKRGNLYAADLLGGWIAGMGGTFILIPLFGITSSLLIAATMKLVIYMPGIKRSFIIKSFLKGGRK